MSAEFGSLTDAVPRLTALAAGVPATCDSGTAHERGSAYCDDYDSSVPELLNEELSFLAELQDVETRDRICAYLYAQSAELRAAVALAVESQSWDGVPAAVAAAAERVLS